MGPAIGLNVGDPTEESADGCSWPLVGWSALVLEEVSKAGNHSQADSEFDRL